MTGRVAEAIELFREDFRPQPIQAIDVRHLSELHPHWQAFLADVGVCRRHDAYLWTVNPAECGWLAPLFGLQVTPVAHDAFGNFFCINTDGHLFSFLPHRRQLDLMAMDTLSALTMLAEPEFTDDEQLIRLHRQCVRRQLQLGPGTVYCLVPAIPLGGSFENATITVGGLRAYMELLAQATT